MDENKTTIEIVDQKTGEVTMVNPKALVSEIRDEFLHFRQQQTESQLWNKLSEQDQKDSITEMHNLAFDVVSKIVDVVAQGDHPVIHAILESFTVKDGVVKIVAKGRSDDACVVSLNHVGSKALKIIVADADQYAEDFKEVTADPDEPSMFADEDAKNKKVSEEIFYDEGMDAADKNIDKIKNPYEYNTVAFDQWNKGWDGRQDEIESLRSAGYQARIDGISSALCPWKPKSPAHKRWMVGYDEAKSAETD